MTPIKYSIGYFFRGTLLRIRVRWNHGTSYQLSIGYHIDRDKWDGRRCLRNTFHGSKKVPGATINKKLEYLENKIDEAFQYFERTNHVPSKDDLSSMLVKGSLRRDEMNLFDCFDEFISDGETKKFWTQATAIRIKELKSLLKLFDENITFSGLTQSRLADFITFQTQKSVFENKTLKGGYANSTIKKNFSILKSFLKWASEKGYNTNMAFMKASVKLKDIKKPVVFLTWEELMKIYEHDFSAIPLLEQVRDAFCLCCFTSLRYSDLKSLKKSNVFDNVIILTTRKTGDTITIDLNRRAKAILAKYADNESDYAIPAPSLPKLNDNLKTIGRLCGIDTPMTLTYISGNKRTERTEPKYNLLTSHCGRRTFICNALSMGIAPNIVMKWTGHKDYNAMRPYIDISDSILKDAMKTFDRD